VLSSGFTFLVFISFGARASRITQHFSQNASLHVIKNWIVTRSWKGDCKKGPKVLRSGKVGVAPTKWKSPAQQSPDITHQDIFFGSFFGSGASKRKTSGANCRLATSTSPRYTASLINCGPYRAGWPMIERAFWRWLEPSRIESFAGPYTIYSKSTPPRARSGLTQAAAVRLQLDLYQ